MKKLLLFLLVIFSSTLAFAQNEIKLICKTSFGETMPPLVINFQKDNATWGNPNSYEIVYKTDEWITMFQKNTWSKIGGEIAVLNRLTGEYKRVAIGDFCIDITCQNKRVSNGFYTGNCYQQKY
jgi:hypothetical protein